MNEAQRELLSKLSTTNISDALDAFGLKGAVHGVLPTWPGCCTAIFPTRSSKA